MPLDPSQIAATGVLTPQAIQFQNQKLQSGQQDLQLGNQKLQSGQLDIGSQKLKQASDKLEYSLQTLAQVHDQASHDAWLNNMKSNGIDTTGDPTTYDPEWQKQSLVAGVSMKDKMQMAAMAAYRSSQLQLGYDRVNKGTGGWNPITQSWDTGDASGGQPLPVPALGDQPLPAGATMPIPAAPVGGAATLPPALPVPSGQESGGALAPVPGFKDPQQDPVQASKDAIAAQQAVTGVSQGQRPDLANLPAAQVANMPVSGAPQPAVAQPMAPQVANAPVQPALTAASIAPPPVQKIGETQQQFAVRMRAYTAAQSLAQRGQISQQELDIGQKKIAETTRHNNVMEGGDNGGIPTIDPNLSGDDVLKALPPQMATYVKGLADGSFKMPTPNTRSPAAMKQTEALMALVKQYDPTAEASRQGNVAKTEMGPFANQIRSFSVSISHMDTLSKLADALQNGDVKAINSLGNTFQTQFGSPAPTEFNAAKQIVGDEIIKAVVGSGGGQGDREKAQSVLDAANSPAQLKGVIDTYKKLMAGQLEGYKQQYSGATGRNDFNNKISPAAQQVGAQIPSFKSPSDPAFAQLPAGSKFIDGATGQTMVKH